MDKQNLKRNEDLGEDTHEFEVLENTARQHSTFYSRYDATEFVEFNGFQVKG